MFNHSYSQNIHSQKSKLLLKGFAIFQQKLLGTSSILTRVFPTQYFGNKNTFSAKNIKKKYFSYLQRSNVSHSIPAEVIRPQFHQHCNSWKRAAFYIFLKETQISHYGLLVQPLFSWGCPYRIIVGPISDYLKTVPLPHSYCSTPKCEKGTTFVGIVSDRNYDKKKHLELLFCFTVCVMIVQQMVTFERFPV